MLIFKNAYPFDWLVSAILGLPSQAAVWIPNLHCFMTGILYVYQLLFICHLYVMYLEITARV